VRLVVDEVLCVGHGVCADIAPEWFELDDRGIAKVLVGELTDDQIVAAEAAVLCCPSEAINLER
jgi:ferredoxin